MARGIEMPALSDGAQFPDPSSTERRDDAQENFVQWLIQGRLVAFWMNRMFYWRRFLTDVMRKADSNAESGHAQRRVFDRTKRSRGWRFSTKCLKTKRARDGNVHEAMTAPQSIKRERHRHRSMPCDSGAPTGALFQLDDDFSFCQWWLLTKDNKFISTKEPILWNA